MIEIHVHNVDELARREVGWFKLFVGRTLRRDIRMAVERQIVVELEDELKERGVDATISIRVPTGERRQDADVAPTDAIGDNADRTT